MFISVLTLFAMVNIACENAAEPDETLDDNIQVGSEEANNIDEPGETGVDPEDQEPDPPVEEEVTCEPSASGSLKTASQEIELTDVTVEAEASHGSSACLTRLTLDLQWAGDCGLAATFEASEDAWNITSLSMGACDALAAFQGATFDATASTFGLVSEPIVDAELDEQCVDGATLSMVGRLVFTNGTTTEELMIDGLTISGDVMSVFDEEGACAPAVETCVGVPCGADAYGINCGGCEEGFKCIQSECKVWNCPIQPPFGTEQGNNLTNLNLPDCDGNMVSLHGLCGAPAGYLNLLAGY